MPRKLKTLTLEEHIEVGKRLKNIQKEYMELENIISYAYGKNHPVVNLLRSQKNKINSVCFKMDNEVAKETPLSEWDKHQCGYIYMGGYSAEYEDPNPDSHQE